MFLCPLPLCPELQEPEIFLFLGAYGIRPSSSYAHRHLLETREVIFYPWKRQR
jgi:hypothetical protein